jgi:serine/threonine protein phosphatase PrpC
MDGHGGSFAVRMMGQWLPRLLQCRLSWLAQKGALSPSLVAAALQGAYQETDARWIQSLRAKRMPLQLAKKFRVGDKRSERDVVVEEDQGPPLTQEQMTFLCAQGACALTIVISHSFFVVANTGDCRALLVTRTRQNTDWTCDWLNDIHVASNKKEWARVSEMTRSRDPVPLRPSF